MRTISRVVNGGQVKVGELRNLRMTEIGDTMVVGRAAGWNNDLRIMLCDNVNDLVGDGVDGKGGRAFLLNADGYWMQWRSSDRGRQIGHGGDGGAGDSHIIRSTRINRLCNGVAAGARMNAAGDNGVILAT